MKCVSPWGNSAHPRVKALTEINRGLGCGHFTAIFVACWSPNSPLSDYPLFQHTVKERIPRQADSVSLPCLLHIHRARPLSSASEAHPESAKPGQWASGTAASLRALAHAWPQRRGLEGSPWGQEPNRRPIHQRGMSQCSVCGLSFGLSVCPGGGFIGPQEVSPELET